MAIRVALNHKTSYKYDKLVTLFPQVIRLRPAPHCRTPVTSYSLKVNPQPHFVNWQQDPHSNYLARYVFPDKVSSLEIEVDLIAELSVINPFDFFLESSAEFYPFTYEPWLAEELKPYLACEPVGPLLAEYLKTVPREKIKTVDFLVYLNQRLQSEIKYLIRMDPGVKTCEQILADRTGSCRDTAWLLVQILRNMGLAARFVSGYLIQLVADLKPLDGPAGPAQDFTDLHAWTEVYLPGGGWIGLDPTSGLLTGEGHLPLAATPDPYSAAPITGSVEPCKAEFQFSMSIQRIHEDPRVTKPYTEKQWQAIENLGHRVDAALEAGAVRLTMGGEPTFVSIDDMDGAEWNFTAMGPNKRRLAGELVKRLRTRFAPGGLLHYGQGKWYPGEPLPRWALTCYWRKDGVPIWTHPELFGGEQNLGHNGPLAQRFITALAERLEVQPEHAIPAYEDIWHYLWRERRLPVNVDPLNSKLEDPQERARLAAVFERGLKHIVGYALPIARRNGGLERGWQSGLWFFRQEHMFLIPGDSPMGFRLPLDSLPWVAPGDYPHVYPADPFADRDPLPNPPYHTRRSAYPSNGYSNGNGSARRVGARAPVLTQSAHGPARSAATETEDEVSPEHHVATSLELSTTMPGVIRTAICVEARQGQLHVFLPPTASVEDYLELISAVEETAVELETPVVIEGYPPPHDHRISHVKVTPDPGVIEVNVQPANSWDELVRNTTGLYEDARQCRLGTEKFMLDGRHTGTGGGNHVVMGGPTAAESPFLRRPDVLRSLVAYWNNHPSLSYLFSGLFVGPTSQAPRVDEARHESLYELEIAFQQIHPESSAPPWLVDRVFRHLLVDLTGNTHRAEFCIDKLYSPDSSTGRLGLVEFRAFEMPPHARMSLTQQLLLRALVARFWKQPYTQKLVRWDTGLHDRFTLPHFVNHDFSDVLGELRDAGYAFQDDWFAPHFEFRFPVCGRVTYRGVNVELRQAIEPWHVLGEEVVTGGTSRYVDSSVERLQVKVAGMTDSRHVVTCNGRRVPLHPTGTVGEFVAGVRYRAWQPPSCLHPTIGVHTPLVFDVLDLWSERSIGGCTWHVSHPGGLAFDRFPVNSNEAESRRAARFFKFGHTGGRMPIPSEERNAEFPFTLDLRRG
jgi:uncharacterized protein (DUF2126 family)/transglutaminase-like putative cysteine protease